GADLLLLEVQRRYGAAREIVVEAAVLHRRPVTNIGSMQNSLRPIAYDQLLDRLRPIEEAFGSRRRDRQRTFVGGDDVALRLHLGGEVLQRMMTEPCELDGKAR